MKFVPNAVTVRLARQILLARKHSPVIMFTAGIAGSVTATVLACKATLKLEETLAKAEDTKNEITEAGKEGRSLRTGGVYTEADAQSDLRILRFKTAGEITRLYGPAIAVGVISYGLLTGAHVVLTKRNAGLAAAYAVVDKAFKQYRARVRDELGEDKDREFRYGKVEKEMIVSEDEQGHHVAMVTRIDPATGLSMYAKLFGEGNKNFRLGPEYNRVFIQCQQNYANDLLNSRGHLFLNEVYDMLGLEREPFGQIVGWVKGQGDGFVSFGLDRETREVHDFMTGDESSIWLDFNVDGNVWDLI